MAETAIQTPDDEKKPLGSTGEETPDKKPDSPAGGLTPEEQAEFEQFKEIKKTTGFTKFSESAKEALRLKTEKEVAEAKLAEQASKPLSETELSSKYPDFDLLPESEQERIREVENLKKEVSEIKQSSQREKEFIKVLKEFPDLDADEFERYSEDSENAGIPLRKLAQAFFYEKNKSPKRKGLEKPSGGRISEGKLGEMTLEQLKELSDKQPKRYKKLLLEGKIKVPEK